MNKKTLKQKIFDTIDSIERNPISSIATLVLATTIGLAICTHRPGIQGDYTYSKGVIQGDSVDLYQEIPAGKTRGKAPETAYYLGRVATSDIDTVYTQGIRFLSLRGEQNKTAPKWFGDLSAPQYSKIYSATAFLPGDKK